MVKGTDVLAQIVICTIGIMIVALYATIMIQKVCQ